MAKFIKSIIQFAFFLLCFYIMLIIGAGRLIPGFFRGNILTENKISAKDGSKKRYDEIKKSDIDVMILGSSHAYRGYDPRVFNTYGYKAYNLGSSAQPLVLSEFIYDKYVNTLNPKKLIIDIYPILLENDGGESELNILPIFYNDKSFIKTAINNFDIRVINSLLYFQVFGNPKATKTQMLKNEEYINGGYISTNKISEVNKSYKPESLKIDDKNIEALKNIISDAKSKGIEIYLFQAPLPEKRYKSFTNTKEIDELMSSLGKYYNFNDKMFLPKDYFFDDSHINQKGVDIYNKWVIEKIK